MTASVFGSRLTKRVVTMTTRHRPTNAAHWSTRTMAAAAGISEASIAASHMEESWYAAKSSRYKI